MSIDVKVSTKISPDDWFALRQQGDPLWRRMLSNTCVVIGEGDDAEDLNNNLTDVVNRIVTGKWAFVRNNRETEPRFYFEHKKDLMAFKLTLQKD